MRYRLFDVFFQYLARISLILVVALVGLAALGIWLDRPETVTARIWGDKPVYLLDLAPITEQFGETSARSQAMTVQELVNTQSFLDQVLEGADHSFSQLDDAERALTRRAVRKDLRVTVQGEHVFDITYKTDRPDYGVALLNSLLTVYDATIQELQSRQASGVTAVADSALMSAKLSMDQSVAGLRAYALSHGGKDATALRTDPVFQSLSADADARTADFLGLSARAQESQLARSAAPELQKVAFRVIDAPVASATPFGTHSKTFRLVSFGAIVLVCLMLLFVYVVARRDPRLRSGREVEARLQIRDLGRLPLMKSTAR